MRRNAHEDKGGLICGQLSWLQSIVTLVATAQYGNNDVHSQGEEVPTEAEPDQEPCCGDDGGEQNETERKRILYRHSETKANARSKMSERGADPDDDYNMHQNGKHANGTDVWGRAPLSVAAEAGNVTRVAELIDRGAVVDAVDKFGRSALSYAVSSCRFGVISILICSGATVDVKDKFGRTPLWYAARSRYGTVVAELIRNDADIDAQDSDGRSALLYAARNRDTNQVAMLIKNGANVDAQDNDGRSALLEAARHRDTNQVAMLIKNGANVNAQDSRGRTALWHAASAGDVSGVVMLIQYGAVVDSEDKDGVTPLVAAARPCHFGVVRKLILSASDDQAKNQDGRTTLFYAAEHGELDLVHTLIDKGASVAGKSCLNRSRRECETPVTVAGRAGHMKIFQALIDAGAPINVRSGDDGETPLISAARWDYFGIVQPLIACGGALCYEDVQEDEFPLIPGTLKTMRRLCDATFEFKSVSIRFLDRLESICYHLQQAGAVHHQESTLVSFASIIFRFCSHLFQVKKRWDPLSRFIGSRAITSRIRDFHEELDHFVALLSAENIDSGWKAQWDADQVLLQTHLKEFVGTELMRRLRGKLEVAEAVLLLQYELKTRVDDSSPAMREAIERALKRILFVHQVKDPVVPDWFISRDDVEFHSWNLVRSDRRAKYYEGTWRKTNVMIETSHHASDVFEDVASQWYQLSHPNMVRLFGACHIGSTKFFVYELLPEGRPLLSVLSCATARETDGSRMSAPTRTPAEAGLLWKCLHEIALALQYLHSKGFVHGSLRGEHIVVGSDLIAKLSGMCESVNASTPVDRSLNPWD